MSDAYPLVPLGDVLAKSATQIALEPTERYKQVTIRLWGKGVVQRDEVTGAEIAAAMRFVVHSGQFILSRIDARNGAFGLVPNTLDGAVVSTDFPAFNVVHERLDSSFLDWMSKTEGFVDLCRAASEGTTNRVRLKEDKFLAMRIPLPPLAEQRRIVARIEALATRIAEARGLRQQAVEEVEALRGSAATAQFQIGTDTELVSIDRLADVRGGIQKSPDREPGANPVRYLTVAHVHRNRILLSDPRYFEVKPSELERWRLRAGDVLIIEGNGSADQIGRAALFRGEIEDCVHQNHVIRIRPDQSRIIPEYLSAYLNSPTGQDEVQTRSRTTSGLRSLSVGRIKEISVPVPTLNEQRCVFDYLDSLQRKVDGLKRLQAETAAELDALLPAVLDRAFRGEL